MAIDYCDPFTLQARLGAYVCVAGINNGQIFGYAVPAEEYAAWQKAHHGEEPDWFEEFKEHSVDLDDELYEVFADGDIAAVENEFAELLGGRVEA